MTQRVQHRGRFRSFGTLVAGLVVMAGCGFSSDNPAFAPGNDCEVSDDCVQGVCDQGFCVDMSTGRIQVVIEVLRSPADGVESTPASWVFPSLGVDGVRNFDLSLPLTRVVEGTVRWKGELVPATLRFTRQIAGEEAALGALPVEVDTTQASLVTGSSDEDVDYAATLVAGATYDVAVLPGLDVVVDSGDPSPAIRTLPPIYGTLELDDRVSAEPIRFDVDFPETLEEPCTPVVLTGCLFSGQIVSFDGDTTGPAAGLQVRAIEEATGRIVSSIAETDENGDYQIRVLPGAFPYLIRATSSAGSMEPFPSVSLDPEALFEEDPEEPTVVIPRVDPVRVSGSVQDREQRLVSGATLQFRSTNVFEGTDSGFEGAFQTSSTTGSDGGYSVDLLPGTYEVRVTPPASENAWAPAFAELLVVDSLQDGVEQEPVTLGSQTTLLGTCSTFTGDPASGVTVAARARSEIGGLQRSQETVSSLSGDYEMQLDRGLYDLLIKVPSSTGFPWLVEPETQLDPDGSQISRDWELPPPLIVQGEVLALGEIPMGGAPIRAYVLIEDSGPNASEDGLRAVQVGETTSEEDGTYQLFISPTVGGL
ncbi:MAG: hypothetical protein AAF997_16900 [Myxococcota bacterium]